MGGSGGHSEGGRRPLLLSRRLYWVFAFLGLSLPYRVFLHFSLGSIEVKVKTYPISEVKDVEIAVTCGDFNKESKDSLPGPLSEV